MRLAARQNHLPDVAEPERIVSSTHARGSDAYEVCGRRCKISVSRLSFLRTRIDESKLRGVAIFFE
jgi:hypothetical protein